jgi:hypothetical protein
VDDENQNEEKQHPTDSEKNTSCPEVWIEEKSPLEAREDDQRADIPHLLMEEAKDAPIGGTKRLHENESSDSDKELASSMNCGNSTSELQTVPMDPSLC